VINSNLKPYLAPFTHNTSMTDRQTDGQTMTTMTTAQPLPKYGRLKIEARINSDSFGTIQMSFDRLAH